MQWIIGGNLLKKGGLNKMKRIYIFSLFTRLFTVFGCLFMMYLPINNLTSKGAGIENISAIVVLFIFLILSIYWQWTVGIFFNVKNDRIIFSFYINKNKDVERIMSEIKSIEVIKENHLGFDFIIYYKDGYEETLFYKFYRVSFFEEIQLRRLKRQLNQLFE